MNSYLYGYLASVPEYDYNRLIGYLSEVIATALPEIDLEATLQTIISQGQALSRAKTFSAQERAQDSYNRVMARAGIDAIYLYKVVDLLYAALNNYSDLSTAYIDEINLEIDKIDSVLREMQLRETFTGNIRVFSEEFRNKSRIASPLTNAGLYLDRNGSALPLADISLMHMTLPSAESDIDLLHGAEGDSRALVRIADYCGMPVQTDPRAAIDTSPYTYWDTTVYAREPIRTHTDRPVNGAMIRFNVYLPKIYEVSNIELTPFAIHPVDVRVTINSVTSNYNNVRDKLYVYQDKVATDMITIELVQENYERRVVEFNPKLEEAQMLWDNKTKNNYAEYALTYGSESDRVANAWENRRG